MSVSQVSLPQARRERSLPEFLTADAYILHIYIPTILLTPDILTHYNSLTIYANTDIKDIFICCLIDAFNSNTSLSADIVNGGIPSGISIYSVLLLLSSIGFAISFDKNAPTMDRYYQTSLY